MQLKMKGINMKKAKFFSAFLAVIMLVSVFQPFAVLADDNKEDKSKGKIQITNAYPNDKIAGFRLVNITVNDENKLEYSWNSFVEEFIDNYDVIIETKERLKNDSSENNKEKSEKDKTDVDISAEEFLLYFNSDDKKEDKIANEIIKGVKNYIRENDIKPQIKDFKINEDGTAEVEAKAGFYFFIPSQSTMIYNNMYAYLQPKEMRNGEGFAFDDEPYNLQAMFTPVSVIRTSNKSSSTAGEIIEFKIKADIPQYGKKAKDKSFKIFESLSDGLTLKNDSITVEIEDIPVDKNAYLISKDDEYTVGNTVANSVINTTKQADFTIKISNKQYDSFWKKYRGKKVTVTYCAVFNNDETTNVFENETTESVFNFSCYPYNKKSRAQVFSEVNITTYALDVSKIDSNTNMKLENAKFKLYRDVLDSDDKKKIKTITVAENGSKVEKEVIQIGKEIVTDSNGHAEFTKLEANQDNKKNEYNYYVLETQAPDGYDILDSAATVAFKASETDNKTGHYLVEIENYRGFDFLTSGSTITAITIVVVIAFVGAVVFLSVFIKNNARKKKNQG